MPTIEIDFPSFKALTALRDDESVTEGDVIRRLLGLDKVEQTAPMENASGFWQSEGVSFPIGTELQHWFRDGTVAKAKVTHEGLEVEGKVYKGLSPAGVAVAGHQLNGWRFWYVKNDKGRWVTADSLRGMA